MDLLRNILGKVQSAQNDRLMWQWMKSAQHSEKQAISISVQTPLSNRQQQHEQDQDDTQIRPASSQAVKEFAEQGIESNLTACQSMESLKAQNLLQVAAMMYAFGKSQQDVQPSLCRGCSGFPKP